MRDFLSQKRILILRETKLKRDGYIGTDDSSIDQSHSISHEKTGRQTVVYERRFNRVLDY